MKIFVTGICAMAVLAFGAARGAVIYGFELGETIPNVTIVVGGSLDSYTATGYGFPAGTCVFSGPDSGTPATITFVPAPGFKIGILGFDLGSYIGYGPQSASFSISDGVQTDSFVAGSGAYPGPPTTHLINFVGGQGSSVTLSMGPSTSYFGNLGLDNIQLEVSTVPEPSNILATAFVVTSGLAIRRRKSAI